jgi:hypothetical protein
VLAVVQHQQQFLLPQVIEQLHAWGSSVTCIERQAEGIGQGRGEAGRVAEWGEGREGDPIGKGIGVEKLLGSREREAGLAHPAGGDQGHQANVRVAQARNKVAELMVPADERRECARQTAVNDRDSLVWWLGLERWEIRSQIRGDGLKNVFRTRDIFELMDAKIA